MDKSTLALLILGAVIYLRARQGATAAAQTAEDVADSVRGWFSGHPDDGYTSPAAAETGATPDKLYAWQPEDWK